jgi:hypothetical protein
MIPKRSVEDLLLSSVPTHKGHEPFMKGSYRPIHKCMCGSWALISEKDAPMTRRSRSDDHKTTYPHITQTPVSKGKKKNFVGRS